MRFSILLVLLVIFSSGCVGSTGYIIANAERAVDGDTLELSDRTRVRLLGIETPEKGQMFYGESHARLRELIEGKEISLERDKQNQDRFGRDLRYVFVDGNFVNAILVREGLARVRIIEPNVKYSQVLYDAQTYAKQNKLGVWSVNAPSNCLGFSIVSGGHPEYLRIKNSCDYDIEMTDWKISGDYKHVYTFPRFVAKGNFASFNLHSRNGTSNSTDLFWGIGNAWNKNHDTIVLRDSSGTIVISYTYT